MLFIYGVHYHKLRILQNYYSNVKKTRTFLTKYFVKFVTINGLTE